ncbi:MAG TPA: hypothetical protein VEL70_01845 [Candidatus Acidoferrum sp.]|nr:hypothetical protein [Candidatus Acidoferrum sp.]
MAKVFVSVSLVFIIIFGTTILQNSIAQSQISCGIQTGGIIHTHSDQQQYCIGSADGQKAANNNFQQHAQFNDSPPQSQDLNHTAAYNEGYKNSYNDEWNILMRG